MECRETHMHGATQNEILTQLYVKRFRVSVHMYVFNESRQVVVVSLDKSEVFSESEPRFFFCPLRISDTLEHSAVSPPPATHP